MDLYQLGVVVSATIALAGAIGIVAVRSIIKTVLLLMLVLTSVSALLYAAWGLGFAAAYFMLAVGGLGILILLAASIVEPETEPSPSTREALMALLPAALIALLVYRAAPCKTFSRPIFYTGLVYVLAAGFLVFLSVLISLTILPRSR